MAQPRPLEIGGRLEQRRFDHLRDALEVAAAGGHSLLMVGPPGAGKSLAASRLPSILPPLAAPEALNLCLSAKDAMHFLGHPEGELALAQAVVYLALAPKSNAVYTAYGAVQADIEATAAEPVPLHLRNAPTKLMKELDYGRDYQYAHDVEGRVADMECLPPSLAGRRYYLPTNEGREKLLAQRMEEIARIKEQKRNG